MTLTAERLREVLDYDEQTGKFTRHVDVMAGRYKKQFAARKGDLVGCPHGNGYLTVTISGRHYYLHRLAWLYTHGEWPVADIDHVNGNRSDNRIANLRSVTRGENLRNQTTIMRKSKTGLIGAYVHKEKFRSVIQINGRSVHLGLYVTAEEAHAVYLNAVRSLGGVTQ